MADFSVQETVIYDVPAGTSGRVVLLGNYNSTAGATGGVINPGILTGANGIPIAAATGIRFFDNIQLTPTSTTTTVPVAVITFDTATQKNIATITTGANDKGLFRIEGQMNGA